VSIDVETTAQPPSPRRRAAPSLLYAVKQVELAIRHHLDDLLRPAGVTTGQYTALTVLAQRGPGAGLSSAELARLSFVTAQSMGEMIAALEQRGLIRRRLLVAITPAGEALLEALSAAVRTLEQLMLSGLDDNQVGALRQALNSCRAALSQGSR
jgi:DNA-binding MarR family transcriptional regulator